MPFTSVTRAQFPTNLRNRIGNFRFWDDTELNNAINESLLGYLSVIAASKSALETYVRHLAMELGPAGYRVNALKFGTVESGALQWIFPVEVWDRVKAVRDRMFPAGRMNTMDEVAAFVSVLADEPG